MSRKNIVVFNVLLIALFITGCASTGPTQPRTTMPTTKSTEKISMPSGWDDSIIDKIKAGESTKQVLAVLDFEGNDKLKGKVDLKMSDMLTTALFNTKRFDIVEFYCIHSPTSVSGCRSRKTSRCRICSVWINNFCNKKRY